MKKFAKIALCALAASSVGALIAYKVAKCKKEKAEETCNCCDDATCDCGCHDGSACDCICHDVVTETVAAPAETSDVATEEVQEAIEDTTNNAE